MARYNPGTGEHTAPPTPESIEACSEQEGAFLARVAELHHRPRSAAPYVSNQHILDRLDERISSLRDQLADKRDMIEP